MAVGDRRIGPVSARRMGFRLQATKLYSRTQRSSSGMQLAGDTPGDCGNMHAPMKLRGNKAQTRWISSLQADAHASLVPASPK